MRGRAIAADSNGKTSDRREFLIIPVLALLLVHPLIVHGCSCGHDFDFHLLSWFEAAAQISHGSLHPHWAFTPAWDAGEPRFVFYPPLSWYLGSLLGILLTHLPGVSELAAWTVVPILFTWTALTLSGVTMFRLARSYASGNAALVAAAIYMANPYMLFTAYERTAYGELLAAAWIPLLLDGVLRNRISAARIAVPVALLWLTNAPAAVMACYALALMAAVRLAVDARGSRSLGGLPSGLLSDSVKIAGGTALGLALAGFYIAPAAYERHYVQAAMATIGGMRVDANFLFEHTGVTPDDLLHDQVLRTASWIAVALLAAAVVALLAAGLRNRNPLEEQSRLRIAPLAVLTAVIALLLTPQSALLWRYTPQMAFLQFPWRLLALVAPVGALSIATALSGSIDARSRSALTPLSKRAILASLMLVAALGLPAWRLFRQACDPDDTVSARLALFHSNAGSDPTDEYTPAPADNGTLSPDGPAWWLANSPNAAAPSQATTSAPRTIPTHLIVDAPRAEFLILNLRDYPNWRVTLAHDSAPPQPVTSRVQRADGLIAIAAPAGTSTIDVRYARTADQTAGDAISVLALGAFALFAASGRPRIST